MIHPENFYVIILQEHTHYLGTGKILFVDKEFGSLEEAKQYKHLITQFFALAWES